MDGFSFEKREENKMILKEGNILCPSFSLNIPMSQLHPTFYKSKT
jgi:hypothetical protein